MIGLLFITVDLVRRWRASKAVMVGTFVAILEVLLFLTHHRNGVWDSEVALWEYVVEKSPQNWRAHFHLAVAYYEQGRCIEAVEHCKVVAHSN